MFARLIPFGFFVTECTFISGPQWLLVPKIIPSPPSVKFTGQSEIYKSNSCHFPDGDATVTLYFSTTTSSVTQRYRHSYTVFLYHCCKGISMFKSCYFSYGSASIPLINHCTTFTIVSLVPLVLTFARSCHFADGVVVLFHCTTVPLPQYHHRG